MTETNMPPLPEGLYWKVKGCAIDGPDSPDVETYNGYGIGSYFPDLPPDSYAKRLSESAYIFEVVLCKDTFEDADRVERVTETYTEKVGGFWFGKSYQRTREVNKTVTHKNARKVNYLSSVRLLDDIFDDDFLPDLDGDKLLKDGYVFHEYTNHWNTYRRYRKIEKLTVENIYKAAERAWEKYLNWEHEQALREDLERENAVLRNKFLGDYPPKKLED